MGAPGSGQLRLAKEQAIEQQVQQATEQQGQLQFLGIDPAITPAAASMCTKHAALGGPLRSGLLVALPGK
jgi:hypothetical protein